MKPIPFKVIENGGELVQIGHVREDLAPEVAEAFQANGAQMIIINDDEFMALEREISVPPPPALIPLNQ